ncbi:molybdopterin-dependent oxidoreductase [Fluviibacterium sp. S390]|uniref:molybdopterin-dependent oxidoreductase n=1 Tax=Fluviibacterium sp. S390 TaxID=3415139 RepID=UPI003C7DBAA0
MPAPSDPVILTISGTILHTNDGDVARFDRAMLAGLPRVEFTTETIWTDEATTFSGVPLREVLAHVGAQGSHILAMAINDYSMEIPMDELGDYPIVADLLNGEPMSVRDKGPLWIVYPYDQDDSFQSEVIYSRSVWQLGHIQVLP